MSVWFDIARISAGLNIVLLGALLYIWGRNYVEFRSKHTLGLLLFALFLLAENALSLYIYVVDPTLSAWFASDVPAIAWRGMMALHVLETIGLTFLVWITWD
ncbi:hypothetical protein [Natronocalculus amylovorans]|uniref:Uncharacterized protein n=1 Tax=Natronocalculus amylovorans TaxID=2917812 RepID=A0AAE3K8D8_9EURY|nr:hypothetical protein [Natronocalculus amylovorans]MCL9816928.1 hypothetical protein [Natronocalculus amylovorans]